MPHCIEALHIVSLFWCDVINACDVHGARFVCFDVLETGRARRRRRLNCSGTAHARKRYALRVCHSNAPRCDANEYERKECSIVVKISRWVAKRIRNPSLCRSARFSNSAPPITDGSYERNQPPFPISRRVSAMPHASPSIRMSNHFLNDMWRILVVDFRSPRVSAKLQLFGVSVDGFSRIGVHRERPFWLSCCANFRHSDWRIESKLLHRH